MDASFHEQIDFDVDNAREDVKTYLEGDMKMIMIVYVRHDRWKQHVTALTSLEIYRRSHTLMLDIHMAGGRPLRKVTNANATNLKVDSDQVVYG